MGVWEAPEPDLHRFYTSRYVEDERLRQSPHGRLEFARTQELLRRALPPPPARVLDVGGGTGIHAAWLAEDGYTVVLVDLVAEHVEQAGKLPGVSAAVGEAGALEQPDESFDAVLVLGPLYHLTEATDRGLALREARRVARPGGLVAAAATSRHAGLLDLGAHGLLDDFSLPIVRQAMETGVHDPRLGFTTAYFHTPAVSPAPPRRPDWTASTWSASKVPRDRRSTPTGSSASTSSCRRRSNAPASWSAIRP